jgi:hypothetical protein
VPVLVALHTAARIARPVELVRIALLLRRIAATAAAASLEQSSEHRPDDSRPRLH